MSHALDSFSWKRLDSPMDRATQVMPPPAETDPGPSLDGPVVDDGRGAETGPTESSSAARAFETGLRRACHCRRDGRRRGGCATTEYLVTTTYGARQQTAAERLIGPLVRSSRLRPLRFALTGGTAGVVQLVMLRCLEGVGVPGLLANGLGFLISAQVNFLLSQAFTWADRGLDRAAGETLGRRWARYHVAIAGTALLNMLVFAVARMALPDLVASALGIGVAAVANFILGDRLVFHDREQRGEAARSGAADRSLQAQPTRSNRANPPGPSGNLQVSRSSASARSVRLTVCAPAVGKGPTGQSSPRVTGLRAVT